MSIAENAFDAVETEARPAPEHRQVCELDDADVAKWDDFVLSQSSGTFFHLSGWKKVIEATFGHKTHFLCVKNRGDIEGVLPLGHVSSRLFGNALISTPYCVYGGVLASNKDAELALDAAAVALAEKLKVDYLELRQRDENDLAHPTKELYVTFRKELAGDDATNLASIPRKQRAVVRKGIKAGLVSEIDDDVSRFYAIYSESVRNLGTPVMPLRWFENIVDVFGEACEILTVLDGDSPVSSVMSYFFRDEVLPYYGGGTIDARRCRANDFMYWALMQRATSRGISIFDYGRSKVGTGSYSFKKNWGFEPAKLPYRYHLVKAAEIPDINPLNPKYKLSISAWKRLPVPVSRWLGPLISKHLA